MRKIIVCNWVSLDGFFSGPKGETDWFYWDEELEAHQHNFFKEIDTMLFGRHTYDIMSSYWPTPAASQESPIITNFMNQTKKIVFSKSLQKVQWDNTDLASDLISSNMLALKESAGKNILILGSGSIASQLLTLELVDELQLLINPIILGQGKSMFQSMQKITPMDLIESKTFSNGLMLSKYAKQNTNNL